MRLRDKDRRMVRRHEGLTALSVLAILGTIFWPIAAHASEGARHAMLSGAGVAFFAGLTRTLSKLRKRR
jgi:hypothetical protein